MTTGGATRLFLRQGAAYFVPASSDFMLAGEPTEEPLTQLLYRCTKYYSWFFNLVSLYSLDG